MREPHLKTLLSLFLFFLSLAAADDAAVMAKLLAAITPAPSGWSNSTAPCPWKGVRCDNSGRVTSINLALAKLSGTLPSDLNALSQLTTLSLQGNSFAGALPSMANLSWLQEIYLDGNHFTSIPSGCFGGLTSLQKLSMSTNLNLSPWNFPSELTDSSSLVTLYAGSCNVFGPIPDIFGSFPNLQDLRLSYNNLTGSLPSSFGRSTIRNLWLNNQDLGLSGEIGVLANMPQLTEVWLHKNQFTGPIPDLSALDSLFDLQLGDNLLTGLVPTALTQIQSLRNVTLANNKFQGPHPNFPSTVNVDLSGSNSFCRDVVGDCDPQVSALIAVAGGFGYPRLLADSWQGNDACGTNGWNFVVCMSGKVVIVNFKQQHFSGTISPAFANLTSLKGLFLNDNDLTGPIPDSLATLTQLQVLDVSNNNLTGEIPKFPATVKLTTTGNSLLGIPLSPGSGGAPGSNSVKMNASSPTPQSNRKGVNFLLIIGGISGSVIFSCVILFFILRQRIHPNKWMPGTKANQDPSLKPSFKSDQSRYFSLAEIKLGTDNFSDTLIIGVGGFGNVYKGYIDGGATAVAVKRLKPDSSQGAHEFKTEIETLSRLRHRNLVSLLGHCHQNDEMILVYEYMQRGTLSNHLYKTDKNPPLPWDRRLHVCVCVAAGLHYLHAGATSMIIHRDVKTANILLDEGWTAKVSDFGLSRVGPSCSKGYVSTMVKGSVGYIDPEYYRLLRLTDKSDVYSFGVVLCEVLSGRPPVVWTEEKERMSLAEWACRSYLSDGTLDRIVDPNLRGQIGAECLNKYGEIAVSCLAVDGEKRPSMKQVLTELECAMKLQTGTGGGETINDQELGDADGSDIGIRSGWEDLSGAVFSDIKALNAR